MIELKTWKDLLEEGVITQEQYKRGQAEAVKWVKKIKDMPFIQVPTSELTPVGYTADIISKEGIEDIIWFIKYFFNLTEEDFMGVDMAYPDSDKTYTEEDLSGYKKADLINEYEDFKGEKNERNKRDN